MTTTEMLYGSDFIPLGRGGNGEVFKLTNSEILSKSPTKTLAVKFVLILI